MMKKILCCLVVYVILIGAMSVSVLAINSSDNGTEATNRSIHLEELFTGNNSAEMLIPFFNNNTTSKYQAATRTRDSSRNGDCVDIPPHADMPTVYLTDTEESVASWDSGNDIDAVVLSEVSAENVSMTVCIVYVAIDDDTCVGYDVYVDDVYQFTEGQSGTPDGYCAFNVTEGTHTIEIRKNGRSASKTNNFLCGVFYTWVSMPDYWCEPYDGDCDNPPTVNFGKTAYYEGDTVHITVSTSHPFVDYDIKDCSGSVHQNGTVSDGNSVSYTIPSGASECCNWTICFGWYEVWYEVIPESAEVGVNGKDPSLCTKCYEFYVCPELCVYVAIDDDTCVGYEVYVDEVYQFTEGQSGTPDGFCSFYVTEGTHTIEIRKNGYLASETHNFLCGVPFIWGPDYWCGPVSTPTPEPTPEPTPTPQIKFDTKAPAYPYPSVPGTHTGTIRSIKDVNISELYTYSCAGTGGHTEYAEISNNTWNIETLQPWEGYNGDWYNLSFPESFKLCANKTYNYVIKTGSYPQIHHTGSLLTDNGWINCSNFTDSNGKIYDDWIPAIRLFR
jgi:hypothetical protein